MQRSGGRHKASVAIAAVVIGAIAIALRCWRLSWGLSGRLGHLGFPDEGIMWGPYVRGFIPLSWSSFDQLNLNYPTFYGYVVGLTAALAHRLGMLTTLAPANAYRFFVVDPGAFVVARAVSAASGTLTVALVGFVASRMYSLRVGIAAAAIMAVAPFDVVYSHLASPDVLLATCTATTMVLAYVSAVGSSVWVVFAAGLAAGVATGTKYTGLAMVVPIAWAVGENAVRRRSLRHGAILASLGLGGLAVGIVLSCPPCVIHSDRLMEALRNHLTMNRILYTNLHNNFIAQTLRWYGRPYVYELVASLPFALGWPLYVLGLLGVAVAVWRHELADRVVLATIVPYFLAISASMVVYPRYLLPLLPGLVVLAARGLTFLPGRRAPVAVFTVVFAYSLAFAASHVARFSLDQQHAVARWIADAARGDSYLVGVRVGVPDLMLDYYRLQAPLADANLKYLALADGHWFDDRPEFLVIPEWYAIAIERDIPLSPAARELASLRSGAAGYEQAATWRSSYLQESFYTSLDPAFAGDLWQGEIGFTVYRRARP